MSGSISSVLGEFRQLQPVQAWRSVRALLANPEDTGEVFKIVEALKGNSLRRAVQRLKDSPDGQALLRAKPEVLDSLSDREALRAMPAASLGRAYLEFVESQNLSADGLVAASEESPRGRERDPDERWLANRLRDIHDLQHVMSGYGRDELGELCLLAFMAAQTPNRGIAFIVFMGRRQFRRDAPEIDIDACVAEGRLIGEQSDWFVPVAWEERLAEPLADLRRELGVREPLLYRRVSATFASE